MIQEKSLNWQPDLPAPASEDWREAYGAKKGTNEKRFTYSLSGNPNQTTYQAPNKNPIPFIYSDMKFSGGLTVDTAEYPFFGLWSNSALNKKPLSLTVSGYFRGNEYIKNRNALITALDEITTDEEPGYLTLPLWGRFPVVVVDWDITEKATETGQCAINITFTRAGCPLEKRWELKGKLSKTIPECADAVRKLACASYDAKLKAEIDNDVFTSNFTLFQKELISFVGRIQGTVNQLNAMTNEVSNISNLIAQGIRSPKTLALAMFSATGKIVSSVAEIRNSMVEHTPFFRITNNEKNALFCFLTSNKYHSPIEAVTIKQQITKQESENLYKLNAFYAVSLLLPQLQNTTYQEIKEFFNMYNKLEKSLDLNDPGVYEAVNNLRMATAQAVAEKQISQELSIKLDSGMPILALAQYLGTSEKVLRELNTIADSFVIKGDVRYV